MALVPISRDLHAKTKIRPLPSFSFAAGTTAVPVYGGDMIQMSHEVPIVYVREGASFITAALLGLRGGQNLLVDPQGRWMGAHIPAIWRRGPFRLAQVEGQEAGKMVMCLDDSTGLLSETEGLPLFDETGAPTAVVGAASTQLTQLEQDIRATRAVGALLGRLELIVPWELDIPQPDGSARRVSDLFRIDEARIAGLSAEDLVAVRDAGALPLIYAHLLSLGRIAILSRLTKIADERAHQQAAARKGNLNLDHAFGIVEDDPFLF